MRDDQNRDWLFDNIEAYLNEELTAPELNRFDEMARMNAELNRELNRELDLARSITEALHSRVEVECPDEVTRAVMVHVRRDIWQTWKSRFLSLFQLSALSRLKPAVAMAFLLLVVVSSALLGRGGVSPNPEVAQALTDVKMALAYLSDAGRSTASAVRQDVIGPLVVGPVSRSVNTIMEN